MRYLIYSCCFETPHFETELEVASNALQEGHDVFFLVCEADLKTCFLNPDHKKSICFACQSRIKNGIKFLNISDERVFRLSQFKTEEANYEYSFKTVKELKAFTHQGSDVGLAVASSLISLTRDHLFDTQKYRDRINDGIKTAIMVHETGAQVLNRIKPDVVIMFNGRFWNTGLC